MPTWLKYLLIGAIVGWFIGMVLPYIFVAFLLLCVALH